MPKKSRRLAATYALKGKKKAEPNRAALANLYSGEDEVAHVDHAVGTVVNRHDKVDSWSYRYVAQDLRKMGMFIGVMIVVMIVLTIVLN